MRALKWLGILFACYVGFVLLFELVFLRMMQPTLESTGIPMLVITSAASTIFRVCSWRTGEPIG